MERKAVADRGPMVSLKKKKKKKKKTFGRAVLNGFSSDCSITVSQSKIQKEMQ